MIAYCIIVDQCQPKQMQIFSQVLRHGAVTEDEEREMRGLAAKINPVLEEHFKTIAAKAKASNSFSGPESFAPAIEARVLANRRKKP